MSDFSPNTTRASVEVARVALERMRGDVPDQHERPEAPVTMAVRASDAWKGVEQVLRALTGRGELAGQALLSEARRLDVLDMEGTHALLALREWVERTLAPGSAAQMLTLAPTEAEKDVARNALAVLDRVVGSSQNAAPSVAPPPPFVRPDPPVVASAPASTFGPPTGGSFVRAAAPVAPAQFEPAKSSRPGALIMSVIAVVIVLGGAGAWFALKDRIGGASTATDEGAAAYARGSKEAARLAFVQALEKNPNDVRALTYLGRISRELGNLATARMYLETALRIDDKNALALREFGSALLADQQPELARRFYVRAVAANPSDRVAQGFLGCALMRLDRSEEGLKWMARAGTGEWTACGSSINPQAAPPVAKD